MSRLKYVPSAQQGKQMHSHLDFLQSSRAVLSAIGNVNANSSGTEFSAVPLEKLDIFENSNCNSLLQKIAKMNIPPFELADVALEMSKIFMVSKNFFDERCDRLNEIESGLIKSIVEYNRFRAFAWTIAAYCDEKNTSPNKLDINILTGLLSDSLAKEYLNFELDSFLPALCSCDDIHVYYVPAGISSTEKKQLLKMWDNDDDMADSSIQSLEELRNELEYLYPAIARIYNYVSLTRKPEDGPLVGFVEDNLYVWCTLAYAARKPFFTEDGPMNCFWGSYASPQDNPVEWFAEFRADQWMKQHKNSLTKYPEFAFNGKTFVFTGVKHLPEWENIKTKLAERGGFLRTDISDKTDYLVCNPSDAVDSKLEKALEQNNNGAKISIVLWNDFLIAFGAKSASKGTETKLSNDINRRPKVDEKDRIKLSYTLGKKIKENDFSIDIPDEAEAHLNDWKGFSKKDENSQKTDEYEFAVIPFDTETKIVHIIEAVALCAGFAYPTMYNITEARTVDFDLPNLKGCVLFGYNVAQFSAIAQTTINNNTTLIILQVNDVEKANRAAYEQLFFDMLEHVHVKNPPKELAKLSDYAQETENGNEISKLLSLITEFNNSYLWAGNTVIELLVKKFNESHKNFSLLHKECKTALDTIVYYAEKDLLTAEMLYFLKCLQYPGNPKIKELKKCVAEFAKAANWTCNLDPLTIESSCRTAIKIKDNLESTPENIIEILKNHKAADTTELKKTVKKTCIQYKSLKEDEKSTDDYKTTSPQSATPGPSTLKNQREQLKKENLKNRNAQYEFDKVCREWASAYKDIRQKRAEEYKKILGKEISAREAEFAACTKEKTEKLSLETEALSSKLSDLKAKLTQTGFFDFSEKSRLKQEMHDLESQINENKNQMENLESELKKKQSTAEKDVDTAKIIQLLNRMVPLPANPKIPSSAPRINSSKSSDETKGKILLFLDKHGKCSPSEILNSLGMSASSTLNMRLRKMTDEGYLSCTDERGVPYFSTDYNRINEMKPFIEFIKENPDMSALEIMALTSKSYSIVVENLNHLLELGIISPSKTNGNQCFRCNNLSIPPKKEEIY